MSEQKKENALSQFEVEHWPIDRPKPYPKNAKKHPKDQVRKLAAIIEEVGFRQPIVVDDDGIIIIGHGRLLAAQELGLATVPVHVAHGLSEAQVKALRLADNKLNESGWDKALVFEELKELDLSGYDITLTGFEMDDILDPKNSGGSLAVPDAPVSKLGDLYALGDHRLLCGDATDPAAYARLMGEERAALCFTDPPYNIDYQESGGGEREGILNDSMSDADFRAFLLAFLTNAMAYTPGTFYVCMSPGELANLRQTFEAAGGHWQSFIIWVKNTFTLSRSDWQNQYEPILYGWNDKDKSLRHFAGHRDEGNVWENLDTLKPEVKGGKTIIRLGDYHLELDGEDIQGRVVRKLQKTDIWRVKKPARSVEHPTMKPIKLVTKAVRSSSKRGDIVLDPFGGSGSTLIACEEAGRRARLMELDPKYADVIVARWEELTGKSAEKL